MSFMARILFSFLTAVIICSCDRSPEQIIGIKIYDYKGDFGQLAARWVDMGINTAFVSTRLAADMNFREALKEGILKCSSSFRFFLILRS